MPSSIFTVTTTLQPGVQLDIDAAELERLDELGAIDQILAVDAPADRVVITDGEIPTDRPIGTVWFDRSMP